ncbi:MAG: OmpH family outer membrane protein [Thermodesulfobacteriota bacterium]
MKRLVLFTALFFVLAFSSGAFAAGVKIAHINLQKALNESKAGAAARDDLKKEFTEHEKELNVKQQELKKLKDEIDKKGSVWNKETKEAKEKEFQAKVQNLQKQFADYSDELNKKKVQRENGIIEGLRDVIKKMAKTQGYDYVFESSMGGVLHAPEDADITGAVINAYDEEFKRQNQK